jgi:hypothetical protein
LIKKIKDEENEDAKRRLISTFINTVSSDPHGYEEYLMGLDTETAVTIGSHINRTIVSIEKDLGDSLVYTAGEENRICPSQEISMVVKEINSLETVLDLLPN